MREFISFDFETANENRHSACAIGLVHFGVDGEIEDRISTLLRPHPDFGFFSPFNISIHGITPEQVVDAPTWDEVFTSISRFIGNLPIVAHNLAFDGHVLNKINSLYGKPFVNNRRFCTVRIARKLLNREEIGKMSLDNIARHILPGASFEHHNALDDAIMCGKIFQYFQEMHPFETIEELCQPVSDSFEFGKPKQMRGVRDKGSELAGLGEKKVQSFEKLASGYTDRSILCGENVVFTGTLERGIRTDMQKLVEHLGGEAGKSITKKTTILVVGMLDTSRFVHGENISSKMKKAISLREAGSPIEVISEDEFFNRLV